MHDILRDVLDSVLEIKPVLVAEERLLLALLELYFVNGISK